MFSIKGAGTVVTGTLWSGSARTGDEVEVLPSGLRTRVRSVQVHGEPVDRADAGHRVALNLNAVSTDEVRPGDFLAAPGAASATDRFDAHLAFLGVPGKGKPLVSGARVHVAHGTREVTGRVLLMDGRPSLGVGERAYAQIRLDEPLPVAWRDRFVVRSYSPVHVVGGGEVLRARPRRTTTLAPGTLELLDALREGDEAVLQKQRAAIENALLKFHAENPAATGIAKDALRQRCLPRADAGCFDALLDDAVARGAAVADGGEVSHPKAGAGARKLEEQAAEQLRETLAAAAGAPPSTGELIASSGLVDGPATAAELKDAMGTSRKYAIPLLEYFDSQAVTRREGDTRVPGGR